MRYGVGLPDMFRKPSAVTASNDGTLESAKPIALLSESKIEEAKREARGETLCKAIGPFEGASIAKGFVARLAALDVKSKVAREQISAGAGFWVFIKPSTDVQEQKRKLRDIQARGIDSYLIPKGNLSNGISLGMFSKLDLANARIREIENMGYEAEYQKIERSYEEVWVVLSAGEAQKVGSAAWGMLLKGNNQLKEKEKVCLDVDSQ